MLQALLGAAGPLSKIIAGSAGGGDKKKKKKEKSWAEKPLANTASGVPEIGGSSEVAKTAG